MKCKRCGKTLHGDANFCSNCGWDITDYSSKMKSVRFLCKGCNSEMQISTESQIVRCPCCGSTELIIESDDVTIERIRSKTVLEHQKQEFEQEKEIFYREERKEKNSARQEMIITIILCATFLLFFAMLFLR